MRNQALKILGPYLPNKHHFLTISIFIDVYAFDFLRCKSSRHSQPPPIPPPFWNAQFSSPSRIGLTFIESDSILFYINHPLKWCTLLAPHPHIII